VLWLQTELSRNAAELAWARRGAASAQAVRTVSGMISKTSPALRVALFVVLVWFGFWLRSSLCVPRLRPSSLPELATPPIL
jgi:hypothetical protein